MAAQAELAVMVDDVAAHGRAVATDPDTVVVPNLVVLDDPAAAAFIVDGRALGFIGGLFHDQTPDGDAARVRPDDGGGAGLLDEDALRVVTQVEPVGPEVLVELAGLEFVQIQHPGERHAAEEYVLRVGAARDGTLAVRARLGG